MDKKLMANLRLLKKLQNLSSNIFCKEKWGKGALIFVKKDIDYKKSISLLEQEGFKINHTGGFDESYNSYILYVEKKGEN